MRGLAGRVRALLLALFSSVLAPHGAGACDPAGDLLAATAVPVLLTVAPGPDRVHFVKDAMDQAGCPNRSDACRRRPYLVADDDVIATSAAGGYVCATYTGPRPPHRSTSGWLPRDSLAVNLDPAEPLDWAGAWRSGEEKAIDIEAAPDGRIVLKGIATWGADDPDRVARGAVNIAEIEATVAPKGTRAAFALTLDGAVGDYGAAPGDESLCRMRLWRLGAYLVAADTMRCGGQNATFAGAYRRWPD
jgi:hypothetical protein